MGIPNRVSINFPIAADSFVDHAALLLVCVCFSTVGFFAVGPIAAPLPLFVGCGLAIHWLMAYQHAVNWARRADLQLENVSPRILPLRKGRFGFPELRVTRIIAVDKCGPRGGWLVLYRAGSNAFLGTQPKVHWDDENYQSP